MKPSPAQHNLLKKLLENAERYGANSGHVANGHEPRITGALEKAGLITVERRVQASHKWAGQGQQSYRKLMKMPVQTIRLTEKGHAFAKAATGRRASAVSRQASYVNLKRTGDGQYEGTISDTSVRVYRVFLTENSYGQRARIPEWRVSGNGRMLADGHGTKSGAIDSAARVLGVL